MSEQIHAQKQHRTSRQEEGPAVTCTNEANAQEHHRQVVEEVERVLAHIDEMVASMAEMALEAA